jgi:hypothetical protein
MLLNRAIENVFRLKNEATRKQILAKLPFNYADFVNVFSKNQNDELPPHRPSDYKIELLPDATLLRAHPLYSMSTEQLVALKEYLTENFRKEWIISSSAEYDSPVLFAKKPNDGLRLCVNYWKLNARTRKNTYFLPLIEKTLKHFSRTRVYIKLNIRQTFYRIRINEKSKDLTIFRIWFGQYKYKMLPFRFCNGLSIFQQYINFVLFLYLDEFCTTYIDDILIFSEDFSQHEHYVRQMLFKLRAAGLQADIQKSEFSTTETQFLGYILSTSGIAIDSIKVAAVANWKPPAKIKELQAFLGFCNFYRRFISDFNRVAKLFHRLTASFEWEWI